MDCPIFGVGTFLLEGQDAYTIVKAALDRGVRLIDTAYMYGNEVEVGKAIVDSGVKRSELFVISKMDANKHSFNGVLDSIKESLGKLQLEYLDLFLIHTPRGGNIIDTWKGMLNAKELGLSREVGVSNMGEQHIEAIIAAGLPVPAWNEFEIHVWNHMKEKVSKMNDFGVKLIGYCPLARAKCFNTNATFTQVAAELNQTEAVVALRWSITKGYVTIPRTSKVERLYEMVDALIDTNSAKLSDEIMTRLESVDAQFFASMAVKAMWDPVEQQL